MRLIVNRIVAEFNKIFSGTKRVGDSLKLEGRRMSALDVANASTLGYKAESALNVNRAVLSEKTGTIQSFSSNGNSVVDGQGNPVYIKEHQLSVANAQLLGGKTESVLEVDIANRIRVSGAQIIPVSSMFDNAAVYRVKDSAKLGGKTEDTLNVLSAVTASNALKLENKFQNELVVEKSRITSKLVSDIDSTERVESQLRVASSEYIRVGTDLYDLYGIRNWMVTQDQMKTVYVNLAASSNTLTTPGGNKSFTEIMTYIKTDTSSEVYKATRFITPDGAKTGDEYRLWLWSHSGFVTRIGELNANTANRAVRFGDGTTNYNVTEMDARIKATTVDTAANATKLQNNTPDDLFTTIRTRILSDASNMTTGLTAAEAQGLIGNARITTEIKKIQVANADNATTLSTFTLPQIYQAVKDAGAVAHAKYIWSDPTNESAGLKSYIQITADIATAKSDVINNATAAFNTLFKIEGKIEGNTGSKSTLTTTAQTNLVAAINELDAEHGVLSALTTTAKNTLVAAINELDAEHGVLTSLTTTAKGTLVSAINELDAEHGVLTSLTTTAKGTLVAAINEVDTYVRTGGLGTEVNSIETAVGLNTDGTLATISGKNYVNSQSSVLNAIYALDTQLKTTDNKFNSGLTRPTSVLSNAVIFSDIITVGGIVTGISTRSLTPTDIGASASGHTHNYAGAASSGAAATSALAVSVTSTDASQTYYPVITAGVGATQTLYADNATTPFSYNPNTGMVVPDDLTVSGDLIVNGTTTTINTENLVVKDSNIIIAKDNTTLAGADGSGITIEAGTTDITFQYNHASTALKSSVDMDLLTGKTYKINGTTVLSNNTLGSGIITSSLTSVGTITTGTWSGLFGAVSGANLTTLNAANIANGTVAFARLPALYIGTTQVQSGSANQALTGLTTVTATTFSGNLTGTVTGNASSATILESGRTIGMTGDVTWTSPTFNGSGNVTAAATLATITDSGSGTFKKITVNTKGLVTGTQAVVQADITGLLGNGSITNAMLVNNTVTVNGSAIALGGSAVVTANTTTSLTLKFDTGATENTSLYTFNGSASKTIDIKGSTHVTLTKAAGTVTISVPNIGGALSTLTTNDKSSVIAAINEIDSYVNTGGLGGEVTRIEAYIGLNNDGYYDSTYWNMGSRAYISAQTTVVGMITTLDGSLKIVDDRVGAFALTSLSTTAKTSLGVAINEVHGRVGAFALTSLSTTAKTSLGVAINEVYGDDTKLFSIIGADRIDVGYTSAGGTYPIIQSATSLYDADKKLDVAIATKLTKASNLSDLSNVATARTNLDVYSTSEVYTTTETYAKTEVYSKTETYAKTETYTQSEVSNLIDQAKLALGTNYSVGDIASRDALAGLTVGDNVFVTNDGDSKWAIYKVTSTTPTFVKIMDEDIFINMLTTAQITKLDGIEAGAQVNTVTSVASRVGDVTLVKADITDFNGADYEPADTTILKSGQIGSIIQGYDVDTVKDSAYNHTDNNYTTTEKNKLSGIAVGAQVNTVTSVAGKVGGVTLVNSDVGLGNVENTTLSTWSGSSNITQVGTISSGIWNGTALGNDYITQGSVTQHQAALSITTGQISDIATYYEPVITTKNSGFNKNFGTDADTIAQGNDQRILDGATAHTWGNHAGAGYLTSFTETDPIFTAWNKSTGISITKAQISNFVETDYEPADATILKSATIGVTVQGYDATTVKDGSYVHTDNNYTTDDKNKLAGIATGAQVNSVTSVATRTGDIVLVKADITDFNGADYEPAITKKTAFNADFGTIAGTVAEGNDSRIVNGQSAYDWGNHASGGYVLSVGHVLTDNNFTEAYKTKLDGIADNANNYTHPATHEISDISGLQSALNGKVDDSQVLTDVPANAVFTDTVYNDTALAGRVSTLEGAGYITGYAVTQADVTAHQAALTIGQTQVTGLADTLSGKSDSTHKHTEFDRPTDVLTGTTVFSDIVVTDGIVTAVTTRTLTATDIGLGNVLDKAITVTSTSVSDGTNTFNKLTETEINAMTIDADTVNGLSVQTAVPAGAVFTDTIYTHPATHEISEVNGLQGALNGKAATHTHGISHVYYDEITISAGDVTSEVKTFEIKSGNSSITTDISSNIKVYVDGKKVRNTEVSVTYTADTKNEIVFGGMKYVVADSVIEIERTMLTIV